MPSQQMWVLVSADLEDPEDWKRMAEAMEKGAREVEANASLYVPRVPGGEIDPPKPDGQGELGV